MIEKLAHYEITETLGVGALGHVYLAKDTKLNRIVALKVLMGSAEDPEQRQRFNLEARALAALKHQNIVDVLDYADPTAEDQYMALEALHGKSLLDLLNDYGSVQEQTALCIGREVAAGLAHAHGQGIVHGDIKPNNIILEDGRVVVIDFGAMKVVAPHDFVGNAEPDPARAAMFQVVGTPGFMAPEQFRDGKLDQRVDIFALGALLYNLTTGELPYSTEERDLRKLHKEAKRGRYRDPRDYQPLLTPAFCDLLADCLAPSPGDRPKTAALVSTRIDALLAAHGVEDAAKVLSDYYVNPSLDQAHDLRTVDLLTRELKLALLRDLQIAVKHQEPGRIKDATNRLRYIYDLFDAAERYFLLNVKEKPRLLKGRRRRHLRYFLLGTLLGVFGGAALYAALPGAGACLNTMDKGLLASEGIG